MPDEIYNDGPVSNSTAPQASTFDNVTQPAKAAVVKSPPVKVGSKAVYYSEGLLHKHDATVTKDNEDGTVNLLLSNGNTKTKVATKAGKPGSRYCLIDAPKQQADDKAKADAKLKADEKAKADAKLKADEKAAADEKAKLEQKPE